MFLFKRNGFYYVEFLDPITLKKKRKSTGKKMKKDAFEYVKGLEKLLAKNKTRKILSLDEFEAEYTGLKIKTHSPKYIDSIKFSFKEFKKHILPSIPIERINNVLAEKFIIGVFQRSESTAALIYRTLKAAFYKAEEWGYIERNPFCKVKLPRIKRNLPVFFGEDVLNKIIFTEPDPQLKFLYLFAFNTGLRLSEILNIKWKDINTTERILSVANTEEFTIKNKKERIIPLNDFIFGKLLEKRKNNKVISIDLNEFVFYKTKGVRLNAEYVSKRFKRAVKANKDIDQNIHFHSLRHSFASNLVQKGVSLYIVKSLLGHEDLKTTQIYSHLQRENLFDAVRLLNNTGRTAGEVGQCG